MKNKIYQEFFPYAFIYLLLFQSCIPPMTLTQVANLRMEMRVEETLAVTNISPEHKFILDSNFTPDEIEVHSYILSSGDYESHYFLAFRNKNLFFWGYPHEYAREKDPFINEIGQKAVIKLNEL